MPAALTTPDLPGAPLVRPAWRSWAVTHAGAVRASNEDALVDRPDAGLWAVADGAGGHEHGEVASNMLAAMLGALPASLDGADLMARVRAGVAETHQALRAHAASEALATGGPVTIASTLVALLASGSHFACLWAGDSRAYLLRSGVLTRLTRDHSLVQVLVDQGALTDEQAEGHPHANIITRAVGADGPDPELDKVTGLAEAGDRYLLCSDGLTKALDDASVLRLMSGDDPAQRLLAAALDRRASDNVTAVVVAFGTEDGRGGAGPVDRTGIVEEDVDATRLVRPG